MHAGNLPDSDMDKCLLHTSASPALHAGPERLALDGRGGALDLFCIVFLNLTLKSVSGMLLAALLAQLMICCVVICICSPCLLAFLQNLLVTSSFICDNV
jgi:hypothetical protein